jgi:hypothetical protein
MKSAIEPACSTHQPQTGNAAVYHIHATIHAMPVGPLSTRNVSLDRACLTALEVPTGKPHSPLPVTFEQAAEVLQRLPRMFLEPDGNFVWTADASPGWQLDGLLIDDGRRLLHVELHGTCLAEPFDQLLRAVGWPDAPVMFQLIRQGLFVSETEFRRFASGGNPEA